MLGFKNLSRRLQVKRVHRNLIACLAGIVVIIFGWVAYDTYRGIGLCNEIAQGTAVDELPQLAIKHGVALHWLKSTAFDTTANNWVSFVPIGPTFGEFACEIHHDKKTVVSAKMSREP